MASNYLSPAKGSIKNYLDDADYFLDINGISRHSDNNYPYNENNYGLGITATKGDDIVNVLTAGGYKNSRNKPSFYAAAGLAKRFGNEYYADIGAVGGAVTGYDNAISPMLAAMLSLGKKDRAKLNFFLTPKYKDKPSVVMMNLGIPLK